MVTTGITTNISTRVMVIKVTKDIRLSMVTKSTMLVIMVNITRRYDQNIK